MKAISVHTIFIIAVVALGLLITILIIFNFLSFMEPEVSELMCKAKFIEYCVEWRLKGLDPNNPPKPSWDERNPKGCEKFKIFEPTVEDCK